MSQKTENQVAEMKKQTIGVEVEMNSITRPAAAKLAAAPHSLTVHPALTIEPSVTAPSPRPNPLVCPLKL